MPRAIDATERAFLAIEKTEPSVHAWAWLDRDAAFRDASEVDLRAAEQSQPLGGITVGVKDIFDVANMPTVAGFAPFSRREPAAANAGVVERLRSAGAVILGKTVTTQFAVGDPPITRNPWNVERTPGGSSSGSAAAVAAGHVDLAIGSQTTGSTLRPAAFCGVYGLKPSFNWAARTGMFPLAHSLDHVGLIARDLDVLEAAFRIASNPAGPERPNPRATGAPRLGVWRDPLQLVNDELREAFEAALEQFRDGGASVDDAPSIAPYDRVFAVQQVIFASEGAAVHHALLERFSSDYAPRVRSFVEVGSVIPAHIYVRAQALRAELRHAAAVAWTGYDAVVIPTVGSTAPTPESTGDTILQAAATLFGFPAISIPAGLDSDHLPWGLQIISPRLGTTSRLLEIARWIDKLLPTLPPPPLG